MDKSLLLNLITILCRSFTVLFIFYFLLMAFLKRLNVRFGVKLFLIISSIFSIVSFVISFCLQNNELNAVMSAVAMVFAFPIFIITEFKRIEYQKEHSINN